MTRTTTPALPLLDELDELRAKATPGPWAQHSSDDQYVIGDVSDDGMSYADVGDTYAFRKREGSYDAALIVAAVNRLPELTAALRGVAEIVQELEIHAEEVGRGEGDFNDVDLERYAARLAAALEASS